MRQIMFMASNCFVETFTVCEATEMETGAPPILVDVGREVVVTAESGKLLEQEGEAVTVLST